MGELCEPKLNRTGKLCEPKLNRMGELCEPQLEIMLNIELENQKMEVKEGTTYIELAKKYEEETGKRPYFINANGATKELRRHVRNNEKLEFLFYDSEFVKAAYARTAIFIFLKAAFEAYNKKLDAGLKFRIGNSYYFEIEEGNITFDMVDHIKAYFDEIVKNAYIINKTSYPKQEAMKIFEEKGMEDVRILFKYNYRPVINLRDIDGYFKYINGSLLFDTSYVKYYDIRKYRNGVLLVLPGTDDEKDVTYKEPGDKFFNIHNISVNWAKQLKINTVGKLNDEIASGNFTDLVIMTESFQDKQIADIAMKIQESDKKLVFIAGPTSSGKTSFSHRLMYHLKALELMPHPISCDDFFREREETPKKENGEYDFENIQSVDIELLNSTLSKLLNKEEVVIPKFDFAVGTKLFTRKPLKIDNNDIVILEGIHCLNPELTPNIPADKIFRVYVSALTEVCIDNANRIATSDLRLIRRLVRDNRTRNTNAKTTLQRWKDVREGEEKYIFPYQEEADIVFNSALIYEFSVLKVKALPLLYQISDDPEVAEIAKRLIKMLTYFLGVDTEIIPKHSLVREFIGGGSINVG